MTNTETTNTEITKTVKVAVKVSIKEAGIEETVFFQIEDSIEFNEFQDKLMYLINNFKK